MAKQYLVSIQHRVAAQDEAGQPVDTWVELDTAWADIRMLSGLEAIKAGMVTSVKNASIQLHYRTDITSAMRVVHGGVTYEVRAVLPEMLRRRDVNLVCEVVA